MACGTPVVASQVGGLAYLVHDGETGFTVPTSDPTALADRLMTLMKDTELRERLGRQAAEFARGYGWNIIAPRLVNVYETLQNGSFQ
jgi:D-inositol-3-phosphate glycosyltransferase